MLLVVLFVLVLLLLAGLNIAVSIWLHSRVSSTTEKDDASKNEQSWFGEFGMDFEHPPLLRIKKFRFVEELVTRTEKKTGEGKDKRIRICENDELDGVLNELVKLVVRDFVQNWYGKLSSDGKFQEMVYEEIAEATREIFKRVEGMELEKFVLGEVVRLITKQLYNYRKADRTASWMKGIRDNKEYREMGKKELIEKIFKEGIIHPALSIQGKDSQAVNEYGFTETEVEGIGVHIRRQMERVLKNVISPVATKNKTRMILLVEIMTNKVVAPLIMQFSDPLLLNNLLDKKLDELIAAHKQAHKRQTKAEKERIVEEAAQRASRNLKSFVETILKSSDNEEELNQLREKAMEQIRKKRILILGRKRDEIVHGELVSDVISYINQLYSIRKAIDRRLTKMMARATKESEKERKGKDKNKNKGKVKDKDKSTDKGVDIQIGYEDKRGSMEGKKMRTGAENGNLPPMLMVPSQSYGSSLSGANRLFEDREESESNRESMGYFPQDEIASIRAPVFSLMEILDNMSGLSAFAEFMELIGKQFVFEFWMNVHGLLKSKYVISDVIISSIWKTYFTRRVDELETDEDHISSVQKAIKRYRKPNSMALEELDGRQVEEIFALMVNVYDDVFTNINEKYYPEFLKSVFYKRFLQMYAISPNISGTFLGFERVNSIKSTRIEKCQVSSVDTSNIYCASTSKLNENDTSIGLSKYNLPSEMSSGSNSGRDDDSHSDEYSDSGEYSSNMDSDIGDVIGRNVSAKKYSSSSEGHRVVKGKGSTEVNKLVFQGSLDKTRRMCSMSTIETGSIASGRSITISNAGSRGSSVMVISTTENIRGNVVNFNERSALECLHQAEEVTSLSQNTLTLATDSAGSVRIESTAPLPKGVLGYLKELVSVNNNNSKNNNSNDGELNGKGYKSKNGIKINPININKHIDYSCKSSKNSDISSIGVNGVETKSIRTSTKKAPGHKGGLIPITLLYKSNKIYKNSSGEIATVNKFLNQSLKRPTTKGDLFVAEKISFCEDLLKKLQNKKLMLLKSIQEAALNDELVEFEKYCEELELLDRLAQDVGCYIEEKTSDIVRITPGSATITVSMPHEPAVSDGLKKRSLPTHINADNVSTDSGKHKVFATKHKRKFSLSQNRAKKTGLNGEMVIYTIYIQLALPSLTLSWSVNKTYSDLIELHSALKKEFPMFVKPTDLSLNKPNSLFFSRPARMLRNKQLIQKYLETLLANKSICDSCIFRQLLTSTAPPDLAALRKFTWILSNRDVNGSHITQLAAHYHPLTTEDHNTTRYSRYSSSISHASTQSSGVSGLTHSPIDLSANQQETSNNFHFPNETSISSSSPPSQNSPTFFKLRRRRVLSPVITKYSPYSALPGNKNVYTETAHKQHLKLLNDPFSASAKNDQISDILSIRDKSEPDQLSADGGPVNSNLLLPAILDNKKKIDKSWLLFDFISELFNLRSKNSSTWIRRQALYILFTNYINMHLFKNKAKRNPVTFISLPPAPTLAHYISTNLMDLLWPDRSKPFNPPPKQVFSTENYQKVKEKLAIVMPLLVGSLVGKKNSVEGPTRFLECIQIPRFNASYYLYIFDALIEFLFD